MTNLLSLLPQVRGRYIENAPLAPQVWFHVGGAAEVLFKPKDMQDLQHFLRHLPHDIPLTILGVGSNVLIRDGGIDGVVVRLPGIFAHIATKERSLICGAGALDRTVALTAAQLGLGGLEFLAGVPGTIGGAVKMNAGAYGTEIKDVLHSATVLTRQGEYKKLSNEDLGFTYRHSELPHDWIILEATLQGVPGEPAEIHERIQNIMQERDKAQPTRARTGGSTFKNPTDAKAWELIDQAGARGRQLGGAQVSEKHCNFLINTGDATGAELEQLGEDVRLLVQEKTGVTLEWEVIRLGKRKESS